MALSYQTAVSDGTLTQLVLTIEYADRDEITVYIDGIYIPSTAGRYEWVGVTDPIILLNPAVPLNSVLTVRRNTVLTHPRNVYTAGAQFNPDTLDENFMQMLRVAQEVKELAGGGSTPSDTVRSFNARTGDVLLRGMDIVTALGYTPAAVGGGGEGLPSYSTGRVFAYQRAPVMPTGSPGAITFSFTTGSIQSPNILANGWLKQIPEGAYPLWVTVATANATSETDQIGADEWTSPVILVKDGANGLNVATVYLYQRTTSTTPPGKPTGNVTYAFANGVTGNVSNGWSSQVPPNTAGKVYLWVITATAATTDGVDIILPSEWAEPQILSKDGSDGDQGPPGQDGGGGRGTVNIAQCCYSSWSNSAANAAIAEAGYGTPINRDVVTLYNNSGFASTRFYDNGSWMTMAAYINGNLLVDGTVAAAAVSAGTFTGQIFRTATSGTRVHINEGSNNRIRWYSGSTIIAEIGGGLSAGASTAVFANASVNPTVAISNTGGGGAALSVTSSAAGVYASSTSGSAAAVTATNSSTGDALLVGGVLNTVAKSAYAGVAFLNDVLPKTNNGYELGAGFNPWKGIYSSTALTVTSDARAKTDVHDTDLGLDFIKTLRPVRYRLLEKSKNVVQEEVTDNGDGGSTPAVLESVPGERVHYGFLAQEVKEALGDKNSAIWCLADKDDPESPQALRYEEMIAPLVKAVQELTARIEALEQQ